MKIGIMQPYFMPYIGYWQLMAIVDKYVVFDDVNFIKRGWANRNNILLNSDKHLFSIALKGASQNKMFNEIFIQDDFVRLMKTIDVAYHKAPFFHEVYCLLEDIVSYEDKILSEFIKNSFQMVLNYLNIETELICSSKLNNDKTFKGQDKILDICKMLGATNYINTIAGQDLYDKNLFAEKGIVLNFLKPNIPKYKQFKNAFVPGLSMIDILMFNTPEQINKMLEDFELI